MEIVSIKSLEKYIKGAIIGADLLLEMHKALMRGETHIKVPKGTIYKLEKKKAERLEKERIESIVAELRIQGMYYDKIKDTSKAISFFEDCVKFGEENKVRVTSYAYCFDRLIILYGRNKQFDDRIAFLQKIIKEYPNSYDINKWKERLDKLQKNK